MTTDSGVLTGRERQVILLVAHGLERTQIPAAAGLGYGTAKAHLKSAYRKLGARNAPDAVRQGFNRGELGPCTVDCAGCRYWADKKERATR